ALRIAQARRDLRCPRGRHRPGRMGHRRCRRHRRSVRPAPSTYRRRRTAAVSKQNRPAARRSSLTGANPAAPARGGETELPAAKTAGSGRDERRKYRHKVSFYQDAEDTDRMRGALVGTMPYEGSRSQSKFISDAVMAEVARSEEHTSELQSRFDIVCR